MLLNFHFLYVTDKSYAIEILHKEENRNKGSGKILHHLTCTSVDKTTDYRTKVPKFSRSNAAYELN